MYIHFRCDRVEHDGSKPRRETGARVRGRKGIGWLFVMALVAVFGFLQLGSGLLRAQAPKPGGPGISYYGLLAIDKPVREVDLRTLKAGTFRLIRIWATWTGPSVSRGSLVDRLGGMKQDQKTALRDVLDYADANSIIVDISFDVEEFVKICTVEGKTDQEKIPWYSNYLAAVRNVSDYIATKPRWKDDVVIDVCNEAIDTSSNIPEDLTYRHTQFRKLEFKDNQKKVWYELVRDLLDLPRDRGMTACFSAKGVGSNDLTTDEANVRRFAEYANKVYTPARYWREPKPLVAPHFSREPCPDGWASRTATRIGWILKEEPTLETLHIYLQEENRRGAPTCCNPQASPEPESPEVVGCRGWTKDCASANNPSYASFKTSYQNAKNIAWNWVFHTNAGFACNGTDRQIYDPVNMDAVEIKIANDIKNW